MQEVTAQVWIAACAHQLQQRWRTVDPAQLEELARDLWMQEDLRAMSPSDAAALWLEPVVAADSAKAPHAE